MPGMPLVKRRWLPMRNLQPELPELVAQISELLEPERVSQPDLERLEQLMLKFDASLVRAVDQRSLGLADIQRLLKDIDGWRVELAGIKSASGRALQRGARRNQANKAYLEAEA